MNDLGSIALVILLAAALNVAFGDLIEDLFDRVTGKVAQWSSELATLAGRAAVTVASKLKSRR